MMQPTTWNVQGTNVTTSNNSAQPQMMYSTMPPFQTQ